LLHVTVNKLVASFATEVKTSMLKTYDNKVVISVFIYLQKDNNICNGKEEKEKVWKLEKRKIYGGMEGVQESS